MCHTPHFSDYGTRAGGNRADGGDKGNDKDMRQLYCGLKYTRSGQSIVFMDLLLGQISCDVFDFRLN